MLVGLWDDRRGIAPRAKLLAQVGAALLVTAAGVRVELTPWPAVNILISLFWFVGITNAVNLMDNMDGLAAGTSAVSALFFTILAASAGQGLVASLAAAVTGASLGFLYYNISPAMIFMGDTGSLLLGFLLAVIGVRYSPSALPLGSTWMVPIVVMGLPIFDTTLVTFSRLLNRRPVSQGGTDHTSHRLARLGLGNHRAVFTMYLAAGILGILAVFMTHSSPELAIVLFGAILAAGLLALIILERMPPIPPNNPMVVILAEDEQADRGDRRGAQAVHQSGGGRLAAAPKRRCGRIICARWRRSRRRSTAGWKQGAGEALGPAARMGKNIPPGRADPAVPGRPRPGKTPQPFTDGGPDRCLPRGEMVRGNPRRRRARPCARRSRRGDFRRRPPWRRMFGKIPTGLSRALEQAILGARRKEKK